MIVYEMQAGIITLSLSSVGVVGEQDVDGGIKNLI